MSGKVKPFDYRTRSTIYTLAIFVVGILGLFSWYSSFLPTFTEKQQSLYRPQFDDTLGVAFADLRYDSQGTANGWQNEERVLFLVPLRDAAEHLPMFFSHMRNMTYPHHLIDISFLVSDSKDDTLGVLYSSLKSIQESSDPDLPFGEIEIFKKDFGQSVGQGFSDRHGFAAQGPRRKNMAKARNWLTAVALKPHHSWVYWRDVDVETIPPTIIEDLMEHDKDIIVPNVWRPLPDWLGGQQPYDLKFMARK
ncbi:unnamed protein product [Pichia kudriavzevii]